MKQRSRQYQRGEAATVVVIVIVAVLASVLAFMAWQNFSQKEEGPTNGDTSQSAGKEGSTDQQKQDGTLAFPDWGVEMINEYPSYGLAITGDTTEGFDSYAITVPETVLFDDTARGDVTQEVGRVVRVNVNTPASELFMGGDAHKTARQAVEDDTEGTLYAVVVGDYVYKYTHRQNSAYEGNVDAEKQADKTLEMIAVETVPAMLKTLRAIE